MSSASISAMFGMVNAPLLQRDYSDNLGNCLKTYYYFRNNKGQEIMFTDDYGEAEMQSRIESLDGVWGFHRREYN